AAVGEGHVVRTEVDPVGMGSALGQPRLLLAETLRVLLVGVGVVDVGPAHPVGVAGGIEHRAGGISELGGVVHRLRDVVELGEAVVADLWVSFRGHQPTIEGWLMSRATASTHCPMKEAVGCWLSPRGPIPEIPQSPNSPQVR